MSLSNIGKIIKAIQTSNIDDLYKLLKGTGSVEKAAELLSKYSNLGKDTNVQALYKAFNLGDIAEAEAALNNVGTAATGVGGKLAEMASTGKNALTGLWTVIKGVVTAFPLLTGAIVASAAAFAVFKKLDDKFVFTQKTANKHFDESSSTFTSTKSELDSLNSQLETTKSRIAELNAMENLSIVDQAELSNLQTQNDLLEAQIAIKQKIATIQEEQATKDAKTKLETKDKKYTFSEDGAETYTNNDIIDDTNSMIERMKFVQQRRDELYKQQANLDLTKFWDKREYNSNTRQIKEYEKEISDLNNKISENITDINESASYFYDVNGNVKTGYESIVDRVNNMNNNYSTGVDAAKSQVEKINNIFAKAKFENVEESLVRLGKKQGKDAIISKISEIEGLSDALDKAGISAETLADQIMYIADPNAYNIDGIKQNLKDIFLKDENVFGPSLFDFFNDKTDKEIENFWNYYSTQNLDGSDWNLEDISYNFKKAQDAAKEVLQENPISLEDLLDKGEEAPSTIQDITDKLQSNISSIKSAMDSLKSGDFKSSDITDLIQQFPELASETDNLEQGLSKLTLSNLNESLIGIREKTKDITDPEKKKNVEKYIQTLLDSVNMSDISFDNIQKIISDNLFASAGSDFNKEILGNNINKLMSQYAGDENAMTAILKLSADPSMAYATITEWIAKIESLRPQIEIDVNTQKLADLGKDLSYIQNDASRIQSDMDNKTALGLKVNESDYAKLISNGNDQITNLKEQIKENENLKKSYNDNPEKAKEYQNAIDECNASIDNMLVSQYEWTEAMQNLPVTNAENLSSSLSSAMSELQSETGLTNDSIKALNTQFSDLEGYDPSSVFYLSAKGVKVNTSALKDFINQQNSIQEGKFTEEINRQKDAIKSYQDQIGLGNTDSKLQAMQSNLEGLMQRQAQYFAQYKSQMEQMSDFQAIQDAKNTKNAGSNYDQMISDLKTAKEAYDKNLVGTDDFKTVAKYLSPNGFEDAANFAENYAKAQRYLTEDSSKGVVNFLEDLNKKGYATYETLANGVKSWKINIEDAKKAAYDMDMGQEFFNDVLAKTQDYGFVDTTVLSETEGTEKIQEANTKLVDAYAKLAEMQSSGASETAIADQMAVIEQLKGQVIDLTTATETYKQVSAESYAEGLSSLKDQVSYLNKIRKEAEKSGNTQLAEGLGKVIENLGKEYGVKITNFEVDETSLNQAIKDAGIGSIENPLSAEDLGLSLSPEETKNFDTTKFKLIEQKDAFKDYFDVLRQYSAEDLQNIKLENGQYDVSGDMTAAEDALQAIADQAGLSQEQVSQLLNALQAIGALKPKVDVDTQSVQDGITKLERMQELGQINSNIDLTANISEMSDDELSQRYTDLINIKAKLVPETDEYDAICSLIEQTEIQQKVNLALNNTNGDIDALLGMEDPEFAVKCGVDVNDEGATEKLSAIRESLQTIKEGADASVTVRMAEDQFGQLLASQNTTEITIDGNNEPAKEKVDETVEYAKDQEPQIKIDADPSQAIDVANTTVANINHRTATIKIDGNTNNLINAVNAAVASINHRTATITVNKSGNGVAHGTMSSPSSVPTHAYGTAYNAINYKNAYSNGKVALEHDEVALVNELGRESIVRGDKWMLLPPGMHTQALKKGDIVLNAQQTEDLMKHGKAKGHARALASGTLAYNGMPAYATINSSGQTIGGNKNTTSDSSTSKDLEKAASDLSSSADSISTASEALSDLIKKISDNVKDWIETLISRTESKINLYKAISENKSSINQKNKNITLAETLTGKEVKYYKDAYKKYMAYADNVASQVGLSAELKKKVQEGIVDIQQLSEDELSKVEAYSKWYDKAIAARQSAEEKYAEQVELAAQKLSNILDVYDSYINKNKTGQDLVSAKLDYRETSGMTISPGSGYTKLIQQQIAYEKSNIAMLKAEYNAYKKQLAEYGKKYGTESTAYREMQANLTGVGRALYESMTSLTEWTKTLDESREQITEWRVNKYSRVSDKLDAATNYKEVADGYTVTEQDYREQIKNNNSQIAALYKEREEKAKSMEKYAYNSEEYQKYADEISQLDVEILNLSADNEELKNSMMELRWKPFDDAQEKLSNLVSEYDSLRDLMNSDTFISDSDGSFTENGLTNLLLLQESIDATKTKMANYRKQIDNLNEQYANGNWSQEEYNEKLKELQDGLLDSAKAAETYKQSILDLYEEQLQKKNELMQEDITGYKNALDAKKKYHDYDKQLKNQTKELNILKAQAAALEGVTDASSKARLAKIKAQIADAEDELEETRYNHEYEMKSDAYDQLSEDIDKNLDNTLNSLRTNTEMQNQVIDSMLAQVTTSYESTFSNLDSIIENHGLVLSETFNDSLDTVEQKLKEVLEQSKSAYEEVSNVFNTGSAKDTKADTAVQASNNTGLKVLTSGNTSKVADTVNNSNNSLGGGTGIEYVSADKVILDQSRVTMFIGDKITLKANVIPENAPANFTWSSSSPKVAKVLNTGVVTAVSKGTAIITVEEARSKKKSTCKVTVVEKPGTFGTLADNNNATQNDELKWTGSLEGNNTTTGTTNTDIWSGIAKDTSMKGNSSLSKDVSIVDRMAYYGYKSDNAARTQLWKNLKGSGTYSGTATQNIWLLNQLKKAGYSKGGIVDNYIPANMLGFLGEAVIANGDKGVIGIKPGEYVIPEEFAKNIKPSMDIMKAFSENINKYATYYNNTENAPIVHYDSLITVNGNVDKNVMDDLKALSKQLVNNREFVNSMTGKISNNIAKDAYAAGVPRRIL